MSGIYVNIDHKSIRETIVLRPVTCTNLFCKQNWPHKIFWFIWLSTQQFYVFSSRVWLSQLSYLRFSLLLLLLSLSLLMLLFLLLLSTIWFIYFAFFCFWLLLQNFVFFSQVFNFCFDNYCVSYSLLFIFCFSLVLTIHGKRFMKWQWPLSEINRTVIIDKNIWVAFNTHETPSYDISNDGVACVYCGQWYKWKINTKTCFSLVLFILCRFNFTEHTKV